MRPLDAAAVATLLREFAARSAFRAGNPYRAKAYARAADSLSALAVPLDRLIAEGRLRQIPGVGEAIADIITKLHRPGTHPSLEAMRAEIPAGVLEMLSVPGLKPDRVLKLHRLLGIGSLAELEQAAREGRIGTTKGLGPALQAKVLQGLEIGRTHKGRRHLNRAGQLLESAAQNLRELHPGLKRIALAGDFRRGCETVAELAVVAEAPDLVDGPVRAMSGEELAVHLTDK